MAQSMTINPGEKVTLTFKGGYEVKISTQVWEDYSSHICYVVRRINFA